MTTWQSLLNEGDFIGAYISQSCPCFVPGDGSWADYYFRLLHYVEQPWHFTEEQFLQCVSVNTQQPRLQDSLQEHWKMYVALSRLYQKPIQTCVFFATFLPQSPSDLARSLARRGDVQGLEIVLQHDQSLSSSCEWIKELPITLSLQTFRQFLSLLCQDDNNNKHVEQLIWFLRQKYKYTGQAQSCVDFVDHVLDYFNHNAKSMDEFQKLREEFIKLRLFEQRNHETTANVMSTVATPYINNHKELGIRLEYMENKMSSILQSMESFLTTRARDDDCDAEGHFECCELIKDLYQQIRQDDLQTSRAECTMHATLNSHDMKRQDQRQVTSAPPIHTDVARVNQVSFSSVDETTTMVDDDDDHDSTFTDKTQHSSHSNIDKVQQLQQTIQTLQNKLQQQAHNHALEQMGDKARIDYLMDIWNQHTPATANEDHETFSPRDVHETSDSDSCLALYVSEQGRIRAVQDLHQERELYAQKMEQLSRLVVVLQQEEAKGETKH